MSWLTRWNWVLRWAWNRVKPDLYAWIRGRAARLPQSTKEAIADWFVAQATHFYRRLFPVLPAPIPSAQLRTVVLEWMEEGNDSLGDLVISLLEAFKP